MNPNPSPLPLSTAAVAHVSFCVQMMVQALSGGEGPGLAPWLARMLRSLLRLQVSCFETSLLIVMSFHFLVLSSGMLRSLLRLQARLVSACSQA